MMLSAGVAIDFTSYARKKSNLQNLLDAAALAFTHDMKNDTEAELKSKVENYLKHHLSDDAYNEIQNIDLTVSHSKDKLRVQAQGVFETKFMKLAGIETLDYDPLAEVRKENGNLEIVLVLDSTGSMALDGKMPALKSSATQFVDDLMSISNDTGNVKIGIVPFARYVNVGLDNRNQPWIEVEDDYSETTTEMVSDIISQSDCTTETFVNNEGLPRTREVCANIEYGEPYEIEVTKEFTWEGCVGSRNYPRNTKDADYSFKVPGVLETVSCPERLTELTDDQTELNGAISALNPNGSTYMPAGLIWGLRTLSSEVPFDEGVSYQDAVANNIRKIIVLMSDGENQSSATPGSFKLHTGNNIAQANAYMNEICDTIKSENIKLFTIGFGNSIPAEALNLLRQCSTDGNNYYHATDGAALTETFSDISSKLTQLFLSR